MQNYLYLLVYVSFYSCQAQNTVVESMKNDIIIFNFKEDNITLLVDKFNTPLYQKDELVIFKQRRQNYGLGYFDKYYYFINDKKDTMNIKCNCGQARNYYLKNFEFKKGYY